MTAPAEPETLTTVDAALARHGPSTNAASSGNTLRLQLRTAHAGTAHCAVPILLRAFTRTPLAHWLYPTVSERGDTLRMVFSQLVDDAVGSGSAVLAYQGGTAVGAVLWTTCPARDKTIPATAGFTPADPDNARLTELTDRLAHCHPPEPHEHLQALAVLPSRERQGIARALLASATTRPPMSRFLLIPGPLQGLVPRRGYQPCGEQITLPNDGPLLHPFWFTPPPKETKR